MLVAGLDEAGRGAVIGPLVIAGVLVKEEDLQRLKELGVRDSKLLSPKRRGELAIEITELVKACELAKLEPKEIDISVKSGRRLHKLNRLEAQVMAKIIGTLRPDKVYVDAADVWEERFKHHILDCLPFRVKIISEHKADRNYTVVSAASIIAKVERDKEIAELAKIHGDFGSGYPSDPKCIAFLKQYLEKVKEYPDFVRKSWEPARKAKSERGSRQTKLI
jgi:ribonuclease HII